DLHKLLGAQHRALRMGTASLTENRHDHGGFPPVSELSAASVIRPFPNFSIVVGGIIHSWKAQPERVIGTS
ncbi:MAG TPA: hypothetical protein PKY30_06030, partial [Myxococcota bacterium]|nr:hypothetical protein [Myxococcota bacterium]